MVDMFEKMPKIKVFTYPQSDIDLSSRLLINDGTEQALSRGDLASSYLEKAIIPKDSWRSLSNRELFNLGVSTSEADTSSSVGIIKLPKQVISPFYSFESSIFKKQDELLLALQSFMWKEAILPIKEYISQLKKDTVDDTIDAISIRPPQLKTVSSNDKDLLVGLHIDSWDRLPLLDRRKSRVRITVNLGLEDRYFLFVDLPAHSLFQILVNDAEDIRNFTWGGKVGREFMLRYSYYPVIKVRLQPGEAYIAPTENIIHDGSTEGKLHFDIVFSSFGHFNAPIL